MFTIIHFEDSCLSDARQILDEVDKENTSGASRGKAYVYAFLAFFCTLAKVSSHVELHGYVTKGDLRLRRTFIISGSAVARRLVSVQNLWRLYMTKLSRGETIPGSLTRTRSRKSKRRKQRKTEAPKVGFVLNPSFDN